MNDELEELDIVSWQSMESAPKDGTRILVQIPYHPDEVIIVTWDKNETWWLNGNTLLLLCWKPTLWLPLPDKNTKLLVNQ